MTNIQSSDPQIHLENIKVEEQIVLKKLKIKEAELRILLSELKALRNMKEESFKLMIEENDYELEEEVLRKEKKEEEDVESIDEIVKDAQEQRQKVTEDTPYQTNTATHQLYNVPQGDQVTVASDSKTINELYTLAEKTEHTADEQKRFFELTSAVVKSKPYEMNTLVKERVDNAYQALKTVLEKRPELANQYKPINETSSVNQFLESLKKSPKIDYKI